MTALRPGLRLAHALPLSALALLYAITASGTTWVDVEVKCPVCGTTNLFQVPASYGSYVYQEPSKFQYVFWPATTTKFLYTCKHCHLTAYMGDFEAIPEDKIPALVKLLELTPYYDIPMTERLPIAEKVYRLLGRDDRFWCEFRRIEGFHLEAASRADEARRARKQALALAEKLLEEPSPTRKETLVIVAAMRRITGDKAGAETALREAETLTYESPELGPESSAGLNRYLDDLISSFRSGR
jgi:hypothetical protein